MVGTDVVVATERAVLEIVVVVLFFVAVSSRQEEASLSERIVLTWLQLLVRMLVEL